MDGCVRVLRSFDSISVISRWWKGEHERLCAMKRHLGSGRISTPAGFEPVTPWSEVGSANRSATQTLLMASEKKIFEYFCFENLAFWLLWQPIKISDLDKIHMVVEDYSRNISVKRFKNICSNTEINANFHFSHYKSMETLSCHSNDSIWATAIKT